VFLLGFSRGAEKQLAWLHYRLLVLKRSIAGSRRSNILDWVIVVVGIIIYIAAGAMYVLVVSQFFGGLYASQPTLTTANVADIETRLFFAQLGSNFFVSGLSSELVWLFNVGFPTSLPAWAASRIQSMGSMFLGTPGAFSAQGGNFAVAEWGQGMPAALRDCLGNTYKQLLEAPLSLGTPLFQAWMSRRGHRQTPPQDSQTTEQ
jgi:hypothetical protein